MTITYDLYSLTDTGIIPKPYVSALGGETYKYESAGGARKKKSRKARKSRKSRKSRKCY